VPILDGDESSVKSVSQKARQQEGKAVHATFVKATPNGTTATR